MTASVIKSAKKSTSAVSVKTASTKGGTAGVTAKIKATTAPKSAGKTSAAVLPKRSTKSPQVAAKAVDAPARKVAATVNVPQSRTGLSNNKTVDGIADKIHRSAVSKATEVATKSPKTPTTVASNALVSEAQLLKMNDKDYMNEAQLAFFKARLQQLEKDLLKNAGETTEHLRETVLVPDPADRATIEEEHALELRTRDRERKLLKKVQQSIASIDGGDYGWCEETGEPIGIPRLLARPTATLSLEAQQRRELKQKLYGD